MRARNQTPGVEPEEETSPWGKWSDRSEAIATSGKGKGVADAGKAVGGMAGKLLAGVAKDIDLVATGGKLAEKMDDKKKADDGGSFWQDRQRHFATETFLAKHFLLVV